MPEISVLKSDANCNIVVQKIVGRYLRVENYSNGSMVLSGPIDQLDITKESNGNIEASALIAKNAAVKVDGNGTVTIYAKDSLAVSGSGNGNVINVGKGKLKAGSEIKGNGEIITDEAE